MRYMLLRVEGEAFVDQADPVLCTEVRQLETAIGNLADGAGANGESYDWMVFELYQGRMVRRSIVFDGFPKIGRIE
jgi:hypothetical protein